MNKVEYCNWTFWECLTPSIKWAVGRDCRGGREEDTQINLVRGNNRNWKAYKAYSASQITLVRGNNRNWKAYSASLEPRYQGQPPLESSKCPNCNKYVNGVNPYDNGETWRM